MPPPRNEDILRALRARRRNAQLLKKSSQISYQSKGTYLPIPNLTPSSRDSAVDHTMRHPQLPTPHCRHHRATQPARSIRSYHPVCTSHCRHPHSMLSMLSILSLLSLLSLARLPRLPRLRSPSSPPLPSSLLCSPRSPPAPRPPRSPDAIDVITAHRGNITKASQLTKYVNARGHNGKKIGQLIYEYIDKVIRGDVPAEDPVPTQVTSPIDVARQQRKRGTSTLERTEDRLNYETRTLPRPRCVQLLRKRRERIPRYMLEHTPRAHSTSTLQHTVKVDRPTAESHIHTAET